MKSIFIGLFIALVVHTAVAQKSPAKFGNILLSDLKMDTYPGDSSVSAFYFFDFGKAYVTVNTVSAVLQYERHFRIKVLKTDGLGQADIVVPLWQDGSTDEKVVSLKATTYNLENGMMVESKMSKESVFKEKLNKHIVLQKFTLPNVKVGSIIECSYTISSDYFTNFPDWKFQHEIPVNHSEYWALIPEFFVFEKYMQGYLSGEYEMKPQNSANWQVNAHHWTMKNVAAFKAEPFMTCEDDYMSKVNFALSHINFPGRPSIEVMGSWAKLNNIMLEHESFGKVIQGSGFLKKKVEELTSGITDPQQKLTAIYNYVKGTIEWNGSEEVFPDNLKDVMEVKKGSSADINLLLAAMLDKADFQAEGVLISTRDHGFIRQAYPMMSQFNDVICQVTIGDKRLLLDATDRYLPMDVLPQRCLNGAGLVISKVNHGWVKLESKVKAKTVVTVDMALLPTGELKGSLALAYDGYDAQQMREGYAKGEKDYVKSFLGDKNWQVEKSEFQNVKEIGLTAKQSHELVVSEHATVAGDMIYINPFVTQQVKENIFKHETREYPVDFGTLIEKTYISKIIVPDGYSVDELPKSRVIMLPGNVARFTYNSTLTGNLITTVSMLQVNKSLFIQNEYPDLREFYNQLVAKQAEQIVVRKK